MKKEYRNRKGKWIGVVSPLGCTCCNKYGKHPRRIKKLGRRTARRRAKRNLYRSAVL